MAESWFCLLSLLCQHQRDAVPGVDSVWKCGDVVGLGTAFMGPPCDFPSQPNKIQPPSSSYH